MTLTHPNGPTRQNRDLSILPIFELEGGERIPRHEMPAHDMPADVAYQIVHDELMLDGNARMNLATFVTTWMEPQAQSLMIDAFDKNMIDKDEYPATAEIERRCVVIVADLFTLSRTRQRWESPRWDGPRSPPRACCRMSTRTPPGLSSEVDDTTPTT